jgi:flagellar biosynthesis/type III secretory pathway protein FliH
MKQKLIKSTEINNGELTLLQKDPEKRGIIKNSTLVAQKEARKIIQEAENYAEMVKKEAFIEAQKEIEKAYEKGTEQALLEFETNLFESREIRKTILRETEKDLLKLSIKLAEKIVGREISLDHTVIVDLVSSALQNVRQQENITLRVNPLDLLLIQKRVDDFKSFSQTKYLDFIGDPRISQGGCLIESEVGKVDARLETQLRVLERALLAQADGQFKKDL